MFASAFRAELANRLGSAVEIATDNNLVTGIIGNVTGDLVLVLVSTGYNSNTRTWVPINTINFIRFTSLTAA